MERAGYVLITPARNEERCIEMTIRSVVSQTVRPEEWVIVSDGSTDRTAGIVQAFQRAHEFITLIRVEGSREAGFDSKARAFRTGEEGLTCTDYRFIGNLDADVSFEPAYFESLLEEFEKDPGLGIGGGEILELVNGQYVSRNTSLSSVAGAVQLFRRKCYEDVGGYIPLARGGIDSAAEIMARMKGWGVRTFRALGVLHHGRVLTGTSNVLAARFNLGVMNYLLGYHPLFQLAACLRRIPGRPWFVGSFSIFLGYTAAFVRRRQRPVSRDFVRFLQREQLRRLCLREKRRADGGRKRDNKGA